MAGRLALMEVVELGSWPPRSPGWPSLIRFDSLRDLLARDSTTVTSCSCFSSSIVNNDLLWPTDLLLISSSVTKLSEPES